MPLRYLDEEGRTTLSVYAEFRDDAAGVTRVDANGQNGPIYIVQDADIEAAGLGPGQYVAFFREGTASGGSNADTLLSHGREVTFDGKQIVDEADFEDVGHVDASSVTPTKTKVPLNSALPSSDDALNGAQIAITLAGVTHWRRVTDYTGASRLCELSAALPSAPTGGEPVRLIGRIE